MELASACFSAQGREAVTIPRAGMIAEREDSVFRFRLQRAGWLDVGMRK